MTDLLELEFLIGPIDEGLADELAAEGIAIAWGPNYCTASTILEPRADAVSEALDFAALLRKHGVSVKELLPSLVNAAAIATRCDVSRPTVSEWTRDASFPPPFALITSPIWAWHEVRAWVGQRAHGKVDLSQEADALSSRDAHQVSSRLSLHGYGKPHGLFTPRSAGAPRMTC